MDPILLVRLDRGVINHAVGSPFSLGGVIDHGAVSSHARGQSPTHRTNFVRRVAIVFVDRHYRFQTVQYGRIFINDCRISVYSWRLFSVLFNKVGSPGRLGSSLGFFVIGRFFGFDHRLNGYNYILVLF